MLRRLVLFFLTGGKPLLDNVRIVCRGIDLEVQDESVQTSTQSLKSLSNTKPCQVVRRECQCMSKCEAGWYSIYRRLYLSQDSMGTREPCFTSIWLAELCHFFQSQTEGSKRVIHTKTISCYPFFLITSGTCNGRTIFTSTDVGHHSEVASFQFAPTKSILIVWIIHDKPLTKLRFFKVKGYSIYVAKQPLILFSILFSLCVTNVTPIHVVKIYLLRRSS